MNNISKQDQSAISDKVQLRKQLRSARRNLQASIQKAAAIGLLEQLLQFGPFIQSQRVAIYLANDGEIDPEQVIDWCQQHDRNCYLPVVRQQNNRNSLLFAEVVPGCRLVENQFGIAEPDVSAEQLVDPWQLDLVLLPLVGFDDSGNRIGMGGGFYDTTFEFLKQSNQSRPMLVGIAHEIQRVAHIAAESWDVPLQTVVTDQAIYSLDSAS